MNSEKYVTLAEFKLNDMFDSMQTVAITAGNEGRLFRIAYNREVPLLLKVPPTFYAFVTLRKELQAIMTLQTYEFNDRALDYSKSCYIGSYGNLVLYLFITVRNGELQVWQVATKSIVHMFDDYTIDMLENIPYLALKNDTIRLPDGLRDCLGKANTSIADAQKIGLSFAARNVDIASVCFAANLFMRTESYAEVGEKPVIENKSIKWLGYDIVQTVKCKMPGFDGFGYQSESNSLYGILSIKGATYLFKGVRECCGRNVGSWNTNEYSFSQLVDLLDGNKGVSQLLPKDCITVSFEEFAKLCQYLMSILLKSK